MVPRSISLAASQRRSARPTGESGIGLATSFRNAERERSQLV